MRHLLNKMHRLGLDLEHLMAVELKGGCVTEAHLRTVLILFGNKLSMIVNGQSPDQLQRLQELELQGKNPHGEAEIDIAEMRLGIKSQTRPRLTPGFIAQAA